MEIAKPSNMAEPGLPPRDHNQPPEVLPYNEVELATHIDGATEFAAAAGEWLDLKVVATKDQAEHLADFIAGCRKRLKEVEAWREKAKKPHLEAGRAVDAAAARPEAFLKKSITSALALLTPYEAEQKRIADAEAARLRQLAQEQAAEAARLAAQAETRNDVVGQVDAEEAKKSAERLARQAEHAAKSNIQSASGAGRTIAAVVTKNVRITNPRLAAMSLASHPDLQRELVRIGNQIVRASTFNGKVPDGFELYEERTLR